MLYIYRKLLLASIAFLLCTVASGQKLKLEYLVIPDSLKKDANAIVRKYNTEIERISLGRLIQKEFIVTCELVDNKILYSRKLVINGGTFKKEEYPQLYDFFDKVGKLDNAKVVLKKI